MIRWMFLLSGFVFPVGLMGQALFEYNAGFDLELIRAGSRSHYYYNEITSEYDLEQWQIQPYQVNLIGTVHWSDEWSTEARILVERRLGKKFDLLRVPLLNIRWTPEDKDYRITAGRFINPFGNFNFRQLPEQRNFIGLPLAYQYYVNISDQIGFVPDMGDVTKVPLNNAPNTWGSSTLYYGGYNTGVRFDWDIQPNQINWAVALVNTAALTQQNFPEPLRLGVNTRLSIRPDPSWEQGFSFSYGSFMRSSEVSDQLADLGQYRQILLGTDYKVGVGWFEFSGELIWSGYRTPYFDAESRSFNDLSEPAQLSSLTGYLDIKYNLPFLARSYLAYRLDGLTFGQLEATGYSSETNWDNRVVRHAIGAGYRINEYLMVRAYASTQQVENKPWDRRQRVFRLMFSAFY